jgi:hypothetical protein
MVVFLLIVCGEARICASPVFRKSVLVKDPVLVPFEDLTSFD